MQAVTTIELAPADVCADLPGAIVGGTGGQRLSMTDPPILDGPIHGWREPFTLLLQLRQRHPLIIHGYLLP